ncbi:MAG: hypothetical protein LBI20_03815 [Holosporales bacterium]|nr:hypothetical protein [Holosporales bacterium]
MRESFFKLKQNARQIISLYLKDFLTKKNTTNNQKKERNSNAMRKAS